MVTEEKVIKEERDRMRKDEVQKKENDTVVHARYLDESILFNIFTRIPADLLHTNHFKYQCRQWRRLISNEYFMDIHNKNISQFKPGIIYMEQVDSGLEHRNLLKYMELSGSKILRVITLHDFKTTQSTINSSCNGLLLITEKNPKNPMVYRILNPVTKKHATFHAMKNNYFCELVFDGEYKVVELYEPDSYGLRSYCAYALRITTLNGAETPKDIQVPDNCNGMYQHANVYINGVFYWAVKNHIVSFDLNTETFHILQTPPEIGRMYRFGLLKISGSLSLVELLYKSISGPYHVTMAGTNVWSMVRGEWEKRLTLNDKPNFVAFLDDTNLLIYRDSHYRLGAYDVKTEERILVDDSKGLVMNVALWPKNWCFGHKVHVNSFLSLNCMA